MKNLTNSSEKKADRSSDGDMDLIFSLYDARESMPMDAEPDEKVEADGAE